MGRGARVKRDLSRFVRWSPIQQRRVLLWVCLFVLLAITIFPQEIVWGRYEQRQAYQESPLSPLTAPLTTTLPTTQSLSITAPLTTPLTGTASGMVTVPITVPATVQAASPLTVPAVEIITAPVTQTTPAMVETGATTTVLVNDGQVSLLLVGAVLVSILVVIAVVISRRR